VSAAAMERAYAEFVRQSYKLAYLRGWHYATRDLWEEAQPRLEDDWDD
jgi:hypothetical protein